MSKQKPESRLDPVMAAALAPFAPPGSEVHRIAADLEYMRLKDSGELRRRDDQRALDLQTQWRTS
ncbi:MAG: hypothetical protein Q7U48_13710 [Hydrogenophaga sp.]|nr:hypothetical protein [Hydrogenophaga sp.]